MKKLLALTLLVTSASLANAGTSESPSAAGSQSSHVKTHRTARAPVAAPLEMDVSAPAVVPEADSLTVTGTRSHSFDFNGTESFVTFRSTTPRTLSSPPSFDVVSEPVRLTVGTGNIDELRVRRIEFPFESAQDRSVKDSDVVKVWLTKFKID